MGPVYNWVTCPTHDIRFIIVIIIYIIIIINSIIIIITIIITNFTIITIFLLFAIPLLHLFVILPCEFRQRWASSERWVTSFQQGEVVIIFWHFLKVTRK